MRTKRLSAGTLGVNALLKRAIAEDVLPVFRGQEQVPASFEAGEVKLLLELTFKRGEGASVSMSSELKKVSTPKRPVELRDGWLRHGQIDVHVADQLDIWGPPVSELPEVGGDEDEDEDEGAGGGLH